MVTTAVICRNCQQSEEVIKAGKSSSGKQRYRCKNCGQYFQVDYCYNACKPGTKVSMALNGSGVNDTVRVLKVGINTVLRTLKKSESGISQ